MTDRRFWSSWALGLLLLTMLVAVLISQWSLSRYSDVVADRLLLLAELRRGAVQNYFDTAHAELKFWSASPTLARYHQRLDSAWKEQGAAAGESVRRSYITSNPHPFGERAKLARAGAEPYDLAHAEIHTIAREFITERGYYDFFLIGMDGNIQYTVEKEDDYATNLLDGSYRDTALGEVFLQALAEPGAVATSDVQRYAPSGDAPALFIATVIPGGAGEATGVLALQLPTDKLLEIMGYTGGMGETGETYLVGQDLLMRSDSRFVATSTVLEQEVATPTVNRALAGEQGVAETPDYRGVDVMSAFTSIEVGRNRWAVMAEIDVAEVRERAAEERPALTGILSLFYGLSLWSVWYWRGRQLPGEEAGGHVPEPAVAASDDGAGLGGI